MILDKEALQSLEAQGKKYKYQSFFGGKDSTNINLCLSNFYPSNFTYSAKESMTSNHKIDYNFTCNEQFFMWKKATYFGDYQTANKIIEHSYDPMMYKHLGRLVKNYNDEEWSLVREEKMLEGLTLKFYQNYNLKRYLKSTKNNILVECNPHDNIWACGLSKNDDYTDVSNWKGQNRLGFCLMKVRETI